jgi:hypothetical protein
MEPATDFLSHRPVNVKILFLDLNPPNWQNRTEVTERMSILPIESKTLMDWVSFSVNVTGLILFVRFHSIPCWVENGVTTGENIDLDRVRPPGKKKKARVQPAIGLQQFEGIASGTPRP